MAKPYDNIAFSVLATSLILSVILLIALQSSYAQSVSTRETRIETFNLRAGQSQTHEMNISVKGSPEITVTSIRFLNDTEGWLSVGMELPHTFKATPGTGNNVTALIPIIATVPASYTGAGVRITTSAEFNYLLGNSTSFTTLTRPIVVEVDNTFDWTWVVILGIIAAAIGIGFVVNRRRQNRFYGMR